MKEQQKILKYINDNHKLRDKIEDNEYQIEIFSRSFLKQLMKIVNWEILVEAYSSDYYHSPDSFFNKCRVEYYDDEILFVKDYSNGESYTVLELDLNTPIEKQVADAVERHNDRLITIEEKTREKELAELKRLKEKYEKDNV